MTTSPGTTRTVHYTRDALAQALSVSTNLGEIVTALGLEDSHYRRKYVGKRLREFGLDCGHLRGVHQRYTPELLARAAAESRTVAEVIRRLGGHEVGGTYAHVGRKLKKFGIDTAHFTGQGHALGSRSPKRRPADQILVKLPAGSVRTSARRLRRALTDLGVEPRCSGCDTGPTWQGRTMTLEVDHINGDLTDNRRENLRYLCPNCHATTDSYCRRKTNR